MAPPQDLHELDLALNQLPSVEEQQALLDATDPALVQAYVEQQGRLGGVLADVQDLVRSGRIGAHVPDALREKALRSVADAVAAALNGDGPAGPLFKPVSLAEFVTGAVRKPRWAIENVWHEGASGIIAGRPKDGKSTLAAELAVSLYAAVNMFGLPAFPARGRPSPILYIQQENADDRAQHDLQRILAARGLGRFVEVPEDVLVGGEIGIEVLTDFKFDSSPLEHFGGDAPRFEVISNKCFNLSSKEHQDWLRAHVAEHGFKYLFLDPLYMLVGATKVTDGGDDLRPHLSWLHQLRNETGCATILTHHMSDKAGGNVASSMLGTTFLHGWYEAALLTRRVTGNIFTVKVDAVRDAGTEADHTLMGLGVGSWFYAGDAQGQTDSADRNAPRVAEKETRKARVRELLDEDPDLTNAQLAEELSVSEKTISNYRKELSE